MKKKGAAISGVLLLFCVLLAGCGTKSSTPGTGTEAPVTDESGQKKAVLADGTYTAEFKTDSGMFHVSEACDGKGTLTVKDGEMMIHISLASKNIVNLYPGLAEDAKKDGAVLLEPTVDTVKYEDGMTEEVHGFDVPVPSLDEEFDLAIIGKKGKWYDHKVSVSNPELLKGETQNPADLEDGHYSIELTFEGGSGKASVLSPAKLTIAGGKVTASIQWDSPNYDYMVVDGEKYYPVNTEGNALFEIPVHQFDEPVPVIGDTVAMSKPHEVEYTLTFHSDTIKCLDEDQNSGPAVKTGVNLDYEGSMKLQYARNFAVDYYEGGYRMLTTKADEAHFLVVPEGKKVPEDLDEKIVVIRQPVQNMYLVASSVMDLFAALDGMDAIAFSGLKEENWYVEEARKAMADGDLVYAGKYNKPDYELIVSKGCSLAVENTMITHSPEVVEKLSDFGIPVLMECSSYEEHPLGRAEWIKFFGALMGKEAEAEKIFKEQTKTLERVEADEKTGETVAFFYITSNGLVQVRRSTDYIPKMIELAGGKYVFTNLGDPEKKRSTLNMQVEEFYHGAKDADYLIYNSSIDGGVANMDELLDKCGVLADFKAVKEGNVWCTTKDVYQQSLSVSGLIEDMHTMLKGGKESTMNYLFRLR